MNKISMIFLISILAISLHAHDKKGHGKMHQEHFQKMDTNGDGKISKEEWQAFHESKFSELDKDGDGFVTKEEMKEFRKEKKEHKK